MGFRDNPGWRREFEDELELGFRPSYWHPPVLANRWLVFLSTIFVLLGILAALVLSGPSHIAIEHDRYDSVRLAATIWANIYWLVPVALVSVGISGLMQYFLLLRRLKYLSIGSWMIVSEIASPFALGLGLLAVVTNFRDANGFLAFLSFGFSIGFWMGVAQWIVLSRAAYLSSRWIIATSLSWTLSFVILWVATSSLPLSLR